ncbi:hypothetical protein ACFGVS_03075 [Mucilaginibacter sp. AW1-7]|uniref:hypothetical protein n=1 Tax=Mucilaginibacter sp. AW1-7 TaxID=3349874 RepID=UPI003F731EB4
MIKINKGAAPVALARAKTRYDGINNPLYVANRRAYNNGTSTFSFTAAYKSDSVKLTLTARQHGKCAFSEAKFVHDDFHVEHFRPKGMVEAWPSGVATYPGYYWMAYDWDNLFLAKSTLNSALKRNFFPLVGRVRRNRNHLDTRVENNLLINPGTENPRSFIRFENEEIKGINRRGKQNIELLGLRSPQLDEARRNLYRKLVNIRDAVDLLLESGVPLTHPKISEFRTTLQEAILPEAEFSSMAIDLLTGWPHL